MKKVKVKMMMRGKGAAGPLRADFLLLWFNAALDEQKEEALTARAPFRPGRGRGGELVRLAIVPDSLGMANELGRATRCGGGAIETRRRLVGGTGWGT